MREKTIIEFNEMLASAAPTPGGGSVSALTGALGSGLGVMVGCMTAGKNDGGAADARLYEITLEARTLQKRLLELIDADAQGFEPLSRVYSMPKDAPERAELLEQCLMKASEAPMEAARLSCRMIELAEEFARLGSTPVVSDAGCAAVICKAALKSAALNVYANTRLMKNREKAEKMNTEVGEMIKKYAPLADGTFDETEKILLQIAD